MTSYMNITVRVASAKALAQLKAVQGQVNATNASLARGAAGASTFNRGLALSPLVKYGNQIQWVGRQLQYNFTLPILLAGGAAAKFALDNEKAFTRISKVYGDLSMDSKVLKNELHSLQGAFVELSNHYGVQQKEVLNIAADWAAAGASGVALARGVEQTLITMVLGEMDAEQATKALISIQAQYRQSTKELADTIGILNIVENQTGASLPDLITGLAKAAGSSRNAGIDVRHLAAYMAALVPAAGSAASAGNALKTIISRLMAPTLDATSLLADMGIKTDDVAWKSLNAVDRIQLLAEAFNKLPQAQKAVVSATLGSRYQLNKFDVLLEAVTNSQSYYHKALDATANRVKYMQQAQKELNTVLNSNPQRLKQIWVILQNAMADVVQPMIPIILMLATAIKDAFTWFTNLDPAIQKAVTVGLLFLALLGPVIRYVGATTALVGILGNAFHGLGRAIFFATSMLFKFAGVLLAPVRIALDLMIATIGGLFGALMGPFGKGMLLIGKIWTAGLLVLVWSLNKTFFLLRTAIYGGFVGMGVVMRQATTVLATVWNAVWVALAGAATTAWIAIQRGFAVFWIAMQEILIAASRSLGVVWFAATLGWRYIFMAGLAAIEGFWKAFLVEMQILLIAWARVMGAIWRASIMLWWGINLAFTRGIPALWAVMGVSLRAVMLGLTVFMSRAWTAIVVGARAGVIALARLVIGGVAALAGGVTVAGAGIALAIGAALAAAIGLAYIFRDDLARMWHQVVQTATDAFNALPAGIAAAMSAVVTIVYKAAMAVYELFSYLNPFASHSPSLVDNVTNGMAEVRKQFATVTQIHNPIMQAYADIKKFGAATADLKKGMDTLDRAKDLKNLRIVAPGAIDEFKTLVKDLQRLEALQTKLGNNPAMKKMEAQINANDIAQKKLRLEMLKMGDAGDIDKIKQKYADLQGQIEMLSGQRSSLRSAGAGGDITGWYDQQISALESQQKALNDQAAPIQKLNDQLAQLQRQGEILNLEDSLQFDPIRQQAEDVATAIRDIQSALSDMTGAADRAVQSGRKANAKGKIVGPGTQAFRDAAGGDFAIPGGKGSQIGREFPNVKDQSGLIDQYTKDLARQTSEMFGKFDVFGPIKKKWNEFMNWIDGTALPKIQSIKDSIKGMFTGIGDSSVIDTVMGKVQAFWNTLKRWGSALKRLFGDDLKHTWEEFKNNAQKAFDEIGPEVEKFKELWKPLKQLFAELKPILKVVAIIIGVVLLGALKIISSVLANTIDPILETFINVFGDIIQVVRGFFQIILGIFTGNQQLFLDGIANIFSGLGQLVFHIITGAGEIILGAVWGIVKGVWDFFTWLSDELVGHSIIPDMCKAIVDYIRKLPEKIWTALKNLGKKLKDRAVEGMTAFWEGVKNKWESVRTWFVALPGKIGTALGNLGSTLLQKGRDLLAGLAEGVRARWDIFRTWITGLGTRFVNALPNPLKILYNAGKQIVEGLISGVTDKLAALGKIGKILAGKLGVNFPGSPVKEGPLKVLNNGYAGGQIVKMLADGMTAQLPTLTSAAEAVARAANPGLSNATLGMPTLTAQSALAASVAPIVTAATARADAAAARAAESATQANNGETHLHFHGDLSFPNINNGEDAQAFIQNLESLAG